MNRWIFLVLMIINFAVRAEAYIDPGSGMAFASGIGSILLAFFALVFGSVALMFRRWVSLVKRGWAGLRQKFSSR